MFPPLLSQEKRHRAISTTCKRGTIGGLFLIFALLFIHNSFEKEESVGAPEFNQIELVDTFFSIGSLPRLMRNSKPYRGAEDPNVSMATCSDPSTMKCQQICLNRQGKGVASTKGESSNEPQAETAHCTRINSKKIRECWDVSKMRCWNSYDGGNLIYDNRHEWLLLRHWQGEFERSSNVNIQWMHLRSTEKELDLFVFSWGEVRPSSMICAQLATVSGLPMRFQSIPRTHGVVFMGHSEGSGWAFCANDYMGQVDLPQLRRVIVSGSIMLDFDLLASMDVETRSNSLSLLVGSTLPVFVGTGSGEKVQPDVLPLSKPEAGATVPAFGFSCSGDIQRGERLQCLSPQPLLSLEDGLRQIKSLGNILGPKLLGDIHSFTNYRECYFACRQYFEKIGYDFTPNIPSYIKGQPSSPIPHLSPTLPPRAQSLNSISGFLLSPIQDRPDSGAPPISPAGPRANLGQRAKSHSKLSDLEQFQLQIDPEALGLKTIQEVDSLKRLPRFPGSGQIQQVDSLEELPRLPTRQIRQDDSMEDLREALQSMSASRNAGAGPSSAGGQAPSYTKN